MQTPSPLEMSELVNVSNSDDIGSPEVPRASFSK